MVKAAPSTQAPIDFGVSADFATIATEPGAGRLTFEAIRGLGVDRVRLPIRWDHVQRDGPMSFDWRAYEQLHREAVWYGLTIVPVIVGCPDEWLDESLSAKTPSGIRYPVGHEALNALGRFALQMAKTFAKFGQLIDNVEIWNEPNGDRLRIDDPNALKRMVETVSAFFQSENRYGHFKSTLMPVAGGILIDDAVSAKLYLEALSRASLPAEVGLNLSPSLGIDVGWGNAVIGAIAGAQSQLGRPVHISTLGIPNRATQDEVVSIIQQLTADRGCKGVSLTLAPAEGGTALIDAAIAGSQGLLSPELEATDLYEALASQSEQSS